MFPSKETMSGNWDLRRWAEPMSWFWFVVDEVNKEKVTSWILNKNRTDLQGQDLCISNRVGSLIIQIFYLPTSYLKCNIFWDKVNYFSYGLSVLWKR